MLQFYRKKEKLIIEGLQNQDQANSLKRVRKS